MTYDAMKSAAHIAAEINEVMQPPQGGASLGAILGAAIVQNVLRDAGYQIVPRQPTQEMERAFQTGSFRPFAERYASMLEAMWPNNAK